MYYTLIVLTFIFVLVLIEWVMIGTNHIQSVLNERKEAPRASSTDTLSLEYLVFSLLKEVIHSNKVFELG